MGKLVPWGYYDIDRHYIPAEEYQISRVSINENTGKEEVLHYSYGDTYYSPRINHFEEFGMVIFPD